MNIKTVMRLFVIINENWNQRNAKASSRESLKRIFKDKDSSKLIEEFSAFLSTLSKEHIKNKPKFTLTFILALLIYNLDNKEKIYASIKNYNLVRQLYGGMSFLLGGKSEDFGMRIQWSDTSFSNKFEFISRFDGEFYWTNREVMEAASLIYLNNQLDFESLALKDKTKLILLNICSNPFDIKVSENFINSLMCNPDELNKNIGFYILTSELRFAISEKENIRHCKNIGIKRNGIGIKTVNKIIKDELQRVEKSLKLCDDATKISLITNYLLTEKSYPICFRKWLLDPQMQRYIVDEIKNKNKLKTLSKINFYLKIINYKVKTSSGVYCGKKIIYDAFVEFIIVSFKNNNVIYQWSDSEKKIFEEICMLLPRISKNKIKKYLLKERTKLMSSEIDRLVRFDIYLKDSKKQEIADGMLGCLG